MITPRELTHRIEHTTLPEAVELFKEKVLNDQLTHYPNLVFRQEIKEAYEQINYDGAFFFFVEPDLGFSRGGLSDCIETEQEKVALLLLGFLRN